MMPNSCLRFLITFSVFLVFCRPDSACARQAPDAGAATPPTVVELLAGEWIGTGTLFGRTAGYRMHWIVGDSGFVHLTFSNSFVDGDGRRTPVLSSRAIYRFSGAAGMGVWIDDRPQQITIEAETTDSSLVSVWSAPTESGRTEYVIAGPDSVVVRDFVDVDGSARPFGTAMYSRSR